MEFNKEKYEMLYKLMNEFCSQAVCNCICSLYKILPQSTDPMRRLSNIINDKEKFEQLMTVYINKCWHSYHDDDDDFVEAYIEGIKDTGIMIHTSCIFTVLSLLIYELLDALKTSFNKFPIIEKAIDPIGKIDVMKPNLRKLLDDITESRTKLKLDAKEVFKCGDYCREVHYVDGKNFA
jgi:hypothetical protein